MRGFIPRVGDYLVLAYPLLFCQVTRKRNGSKYLDIQVINGGWSFCYDTETGTFVNNKLVEGYDASSLDIWFQGRLDALKQLLGDTDLDYNNVLSKMVELHKENKLNDSNTMYQRQYLLTVSRPILCPPLDLNNKGYSYDDEEDGYDDDTPF